MFLLSFLFLLSPLHLMSFMSLVSLPCILPLLPFSSTQYLHYLNIVLSDQGKNCEIGPIKWNLEELDKSGQNDISKLWHHFARFRLCWVSHFFNTTTSHSYIFHVYLPGRPRRNLLAGGAGQALLVVEAGLAPHHVHQEDLGSAPACTVQWMSVVIIIRWWMVGWQHSLCLLAHDDDDPCVLGTRMKNSIWTLSVEVKRESIQKSKPGQIFDSRFCHLKQAPLSPPTAWTWKMVKHAKKWLKLLMWEL